MVLCELEGRSRKEVAGRLKIAEGTLSSRLARARGLLRNRLQKRGLALGAGALAAALPRDVTAAAVRPALANATVQAALRYVAGGTVPCSVTTLTEGALKAMFLAKLKAGAAVLLALCTMASLAALATAPAQADLVVHISKGAQRMTVVRDGQPIHTWVVSTGRSGYGTPSGVFHPQRMARTWFSKAYYNSPMPYSIFFYGGYAIHGTYAINQLGGPASHG